MSRRTRAIYDDPRDMFDFGCRFRGAYDIGNGTVPSITSSGTSASSLAPQMQRYPQTTSAYRQPMNEFQTPLRGYVVTEPCLSAPPTGPTAGQLSAAYYSSPAGRGRTSRNFAYSERTNSPRTPSPAGYTYTSPTAFHPHAISPTAISPKRTFAYAISPTRHFPYKTQPTRHLADGYGVHLQFTYSLPTPFQKLKYDISRRRKRAEVENIVAKYCGEEEAQSPIDSKPHRGNAPSARRKLQFDCGPPEKSGAPRTPRPPKPPGPPKTPGSPKTPGTPGTRSTCGPANAPKSACSTTPKKVKPVSEMFDPADQAVLFGTCPNLAPEESPHCAFQETDKDSDEGFIAKLMKKFKGPTNPCPLKVDFSNRKSRTYGALLRKKSSCFSKKNDSKDESLEQLDDLWNPDTFMRWKCIDNWDQHKESLWRSVIQAKLDCPESHNRCIEDMMYDAFKAMNAPGGECISFRMIYGILRRNEDVYLNPYIDHFTDEQFLKLIVALNRFFMDDKDKRKMFFDHPPPTFIEKIMMKETLGVLDPSCPSQTIARRFWELLLDWYARKINAPDDAQQDC